MVGAEETLSTFCAGPLWDVNLTWNTADPDFTPCFHKTIFVYIPCGFLWVLAFVDQFANWKSLKRNCPWSWINISKLLLTSLLCIICLLELVFFALLVDDDDTLIVGADFVSAGVRLATYLLALTLIWGAKKAGRVASIVQALFWLLLAICQGFTFGSVVNHDLLGLSWSQPNEILVVVSWILIVLNFIVYCFTDYPPTYVDVKEQFENPSPERTTTVLSRVLFLWFDPIVWKGLRKTIQTSDLWSLNPSDSVQTLVPLWENYWNQVREAKKSAGQKAGILIVLVKCFWPTFLLGAIYQLAYVLLQFASPQILGLIISFVEGDDPDWKGYLYTGLFAVVAFLSAISDSSYWYNLNLVGLRLRTTLASTIYKKSLKLSNSSRKTNTAGEIVNLVSVDSQKITDACLMVNMMWSCPLQVALAIYFLYQTIGVAVFVGLALLLLLLPINAIVWSYMEKYQFAQMKKKDERVRIITEILNGMKVLKLYGWEKSFLSRINEIRVEEVEQLRIFQYLEASQFFAWTSAPLIVALASFATFVLIDPVNNILDSQTAFVSLTLFNTMRGPLFLLPFGIVSIIQGLVSIGRIDTFLNMEEINQQNISHDDSKSNPIEIKEASFSWNDNSALSSYDVSDCSLQHINWNVSEGSLVAVVGTVGSGKSSLLSALLGDMIRVRGEANIKGKIAYVPQQAWMQNATLKNNILFGRTYQKDLYEKIIDACALRTDLDILTGGDETEIGEKGINVSGGQKQRISLARAVYNNADIYLLDDPLSAVDSNVGKHIFQKVIGPKGVLRKKTRVLVTHGISYLPQVDQIVVMIDGKISEMGTYEQLLANKGAFADFLIEQLQEDSSDSENENSVLSEAEKDDLKAKLEESLGKKELKKKLAIEAKKAQKRVKTMSLGSLSDPNEVLSEPESIFSLSSATAQAHHPMARRQSSVANPIKRQKSSTAGKLSKDGAIMKTEAEDFQVGRDLIEDETAAENRVKTEIYVYYAKAVGLKLALLAVLCYALFQGFTVGANLWLSVWSEDPEAATDTAKRNLYLGVYGTLGFLQAAFILLAVIVITIGTLKASVTLHQEMLERIVSSTMAFFDTTPVGRIINRFSKDMDEVDLMIPTHIKDILSDLFSVLGTLFVVCYATPIIIAAVIPLVLIFFFIQSSYLATSRQLKRMINVTRSPINSSLTESFSGAPTIRAYKMQDLFILENEQRIEAHQVCNYPEVASNSWLFCRLEGLASFLIIFASLFSIVYRDTVNPGLVGLSLTYALTCQLDLFLFTRYVAELEKSIVSVERIREYQSTPQEAAFELADIDPDPSWPPRGEIVFDDYATRYRDGMDLVLRGVSFRIMPEQKVGIVGRTGAGKSSLTLSLFRIIEAARGSISIDGFNIAQMGLHRLRVALTIIPQDPVLFSGSMRFNLDPFKKYSDEELWRSLEHAHLRGFVSKLPGGLDYTVVEGGENLSVGQRQLVCLARALLRKTKILVLDEATAAVDLETDDLIQATIRSEFSDCTVLTIAHRLKTIMDSNMILVLEAGKVKEFDSPENLLDDHQSTFYSMAKDAGLV